MKVLGLGLGSRLGSLLRLQTRIDPTSISITPQQHVNIISQEEPRLNSQPASTDYAVPSNYLPACLVVYLLSVPRHSVVRTQLGPQLPTKYGVPQATIFQAVFDTDCSRATEEFSRR